MRNYQTVFLVLFIHILGNSIDKFTFAESKSSALTILEPRDGRTIELDQRNLLHVHLRLPERVEIPLHGIVALHIDEKLRGYLCPSMVDAIASCPSSTGHISSREISAHISNFSAGEHIIVADIIDMSGSILYEATSLFSVIPYSPLDAELTRPAFNIIIFSKDRACQLDQLLSSMTQFIPNMFGPDLKVQVLYHHSNADFREGYDVVRKFHPGILFHQQHNLSADTTSAYFDIYQSSQGPPDTFKVAARPRKATRAPHPRPPRTPVLSAGGSLAQADYLRLLDDGIAYTVHFMDDMVRGGGAWG
jgi:hypothetical protein